MSLLLINIPYFLIDLYQFGEKLFLICIPSAEYKNLFYLDLSIFSCDDWNGLERSQQHKLLFFGLVPTKAIVVKHIDPFAFENGLNLMP